MHSFWSLVKVTNEVKIFGIWSEVFKGFVYFVFFFGLSASVASLKSS